MTNDVQQLLTEFVSTNSLITATELDRVLTQEIETDVPQEIARLKFLSTMVKTHCRALMNRSRVNQINMFIKARMMRFLYVVTLNISQIERSQREAAQAEAAYASQPILTFLAKTTLASFTDLSEERLTTLRDLRKKLKTLLAVGLIEASPDFQQIALTPAGWFAIFQEEAGRAQNGPGE
ncbi:MAG: hypothetical protein HOO67_07655 [Candidatus Peribacteraceae bacterium]|nr:hypothetical protein [Candidatus Peribacteraceae bacterium]